MTKQALKPLKPQDVLTLYKCSLKPQRDNMIYCTPRQIMRLVSPAMLIGEPNVNKVYELMVRLGLYNLVYIHGDGKTHRWHVVRLGQPVRSIGFSMSQYPKKLDAFKALIDQIQTHS